MADSRALHNGLANYHQALETHLQELTSEYQKMEKTWYRFSAIYDGDAANQFKTNWMRTVSTFQEYITQTEQISRLLEERITALREVNRLENVLGKGSIENSDAAPSMPTQSQVKKNSITWSERQKIWERVDSGESITINDFNKLSLPISDLQSGTLIEDSSWMSSLEEHYEIMKDAHQAESLPDAILTILKAINYRRKK